MIIILYKIFFNSFCKIKISFIIFNLKIKSQIRNKILIDINNYFMVLLKMIFISMMVLFKYMEFILFSGDKIQRPLDPSLKFPLTFLIDTELDSYFKNGSPSIHRYRFRFRIEISLSLFFSSIVLSLFLIGVKCRVITNVVFVDHRNSSVAVCI